MFNKKPLEIGGSEDPYLRRWYIIPRNKVFCIYLHQMLRDDDDRALHDHPGANISVVLRGGYIEHRFAWRPVAGLLLPPVVSKRQRPGRIIFRLAKLAHRLTLPDGQTESWSLFIMFPKWHEWGFYCQNGRWVHWRDFTAGANGELVGKGCDQ